MSIKVNENYQNLEQNYLFKTIAQKVNAYTELHPDKKIIRLGIGDVTLPLTNKVIEALHAAVDEMGHQETFKGYGNEQGYDFAIDAVMKHYQSYGVTLNKKEVFISDGAKSDCGNITDIFGDNEILIPDPVYPVYLDSNIMCGRKINFIQASQENNFLPMPNEVEKKSYIIYICSPNNPTGAVYSKYQLKQWVDFANETESVIIFDSAYEAYIHGDYPHSIFEIEGSRTCAIEICSLSKTAGFTGTRMGWTIVPIELVCSGTALNPMWNRRQSTKFNGTAYIIQKAGEAALSPDGFKECKEHIAYYMENAKLLSDLLNKKGIWHTGGISSPYIWLKCPNNMSSWEFFDYLLNELQIVGTPGCGFGQQGEGYFRLTAFGSRESTLEAIERLEKAL
ncbi:MAG: LL-diaminopimelate aminotransferase [Erysipelotrichaceae bacterium]|uniref:LL-diaminopimelate aminotransferase n=1 Tax=Floccifex sp. TaxID=2815810 RepID=UPI0029FF31A4|nr:LL-diaminopimelate aminotransferase [Floccifex sp.]MDD7281564.1 LL-diaminopimelate aminotransferase [Erysipelotrichaceae bacterium]MDY2958458.1 LL-diaminopimelate aminotransferase [Floccifex sp.]